MRITVQIKPKARQEKIVKIDTTHFIVHIKEIPEKGRANEGVIRILSTYFNLPKSRVAIISGHSSRTKIIIIGS